MEKGKRIWKDFKFDLVIYIYRKVMYAHKYFCVQEMYIIKYSL